MKKLIMVVLTTLCLIFGASGAFAQTTTVCDAYSGSCATAPPIHDGEVAGPSATTLPDTGFTGGQLVLGGVLLILVGGLVVHSQRTKR